MYAGRYALFSVISVQFESVLHQSEEVCSNRFDGIGRKSFCFFSHFIVVSSHWVFLIKYKDVWLVGMLEAMLLDDRLCVLVGYTGVM